MIDIQPSQYLHDNTALDELSVTEIEILIQQNPACQLYHVLLAQKMSNVYSHNMALRNQDYVLRSMEYSSKDVAQPIHDNLTSINILTEKHLNESSKPELIIDNIDSNIQNEDLILKSSSDEEQNQLISQENIDNNIEIIHEEVNITISIEPENKETEMGEKIDFKKERKKQKKKLKNKINKESSFKLDQFAGITSYTQWLLSFKRNDIEKKIAKELKAQKKQELANIAKKSVTKSNELVSESLADLLVQQGHIDDAKKMYRQLMHKIPEKSRYFAAKIENLLKS